MSNYIHLFLLFFDRLMFDTNSTYLLHVSLSHHLDIVANFDYFERFNTFGPGDVKSWPHIYTHIILETKGLLRNCSYFLFPLFLSVLLVLITGWPKVFGPKKFIGLNWKRLGCSSHKYFQT